MSIRYKTILIFLATALVPFLAIGTLVFIDFQTSLRSNAFRQLEAVTSLQEARVNDYLRVYAEGATYLSEQPALRRAVQAFLDDPRTKPELHQLVQDTKGSPQARVAPIQDVAIADPNGKVLDATEGLAAHPSLPLKPGAILADFLYDDQGAHVLFSAPMLYDGAVRARFYMTINAQTLFAIAAAREGLGQTGETFLVQRLDDRTGLFITPLRFDEQAAFARKILLDQSNRPDALALLKRNETFTDGVVSYRGEPIIAVTKYMPSTGLGIVGQIDKAEVFGPVRQLATELLVFAALLVLFTIFVGSFMAQLFVHPIEKLAMAAAKLRHGNFSAKVKVWSNDEIGQLGRAFNAMADDLAKQERTKSEIIALISHQLRTPVTAVKGFISLVFKSSDKLPAEDAKLLRLAYEENEKLNKLITQILEVAHADAGALTLTKVPTDLAKLITHVAGDHKPMLALRQQTIRLSLVQNPIKIVIDPDRIQFALSNLLSNASKYSPPGSLITIALSQTKHFSWIRVTDSGTGISAADQQKLFQKFSRIENPGGETPEGMGLGLYMAKKIVDLHKGNLIVSSSKNHGSSFTIELPTNV